MMEEKKVEVKVTPCPTKPIHKEGSSLFGQNNPATTA